MSEEMTQLGEMFRARRKELNLSLKEVESSTSIRSQYLQAIEEGKMEKLISPIYAQGFIKQYANFLGMDGEKILAEHVEILTQPIEQDFAYGIGTLEKRNALGGGIKAMPNILLWIAAFFGLGIIAFYLAKTLEVL